MERPELESDTAMTGLASSSHLHAEPRKTSAVGLAFKNWSGPLSGEGFAFRLARQQ